MSIPVPLNGESHSDFAYRAHAAVRGAIPDAETRSLAIINAWRAARRDSDVERAPRLKYQQGGDGHQNGQAGSSQSWREIGFVPVFKEHEYPRIMRDSRGKTMLDEDGEPLVEREKYDFSALASIVENMNHRVADTGDFAPISDAHTPAPGSGDSRPGIVGFAGPFYLGQVGNREPKWAIYAEERWYGDKGAMARELPRRSAEVYLGLPIHQRVLDPIAALGPDTPALDMGVHYAEHNGQLVAKYSGVPLTARYDGASCAAAFPGGGNVALPKEVGDRKRPGKAQYDDEATPGVDGDGGGNDDGSGDGVGGGNDTASYQETNQEQQGDTDSMAISPEDVNVIVEAIMQTAPMQWVQSQMQQASAPVDATPEAGAAPPGGDQQQMSQDASPVPAVGTPDDAGAMAQGGGQGDDQGGPPSLFDDNDGDEVGAGGPGGPAGVGGGMRKPLPDTEKYSRHIAELESRLAAIEANARDSARKAVVAERQRALYSLRTQGFPVDYDRECETCCDPSKMDDAQFSNHLETIKRYSAARRLPVGPMLDFGTPPAPSAVANGANGEPEFAASAAFNQAVAKACYSRQQQPDYSPRDTGLYSRVRGELMAQWRANGGRAPKDTSPPTNGSAVAKKT